MAGFSAEPVPSVFAGGGCRLRPRGPVWIPGAGPFLMTRPVPCRPGRPRALRSLVGFAAILAGCSGSAGFGSVGLGRLGRLLGRLGRLLGLGSTPSSAARPARARRVVARLRARRARRVAARSLLGGRLELHLAAGLGGAIGDQGVDVLVVVVEPFGMAEDEVAVDQVVEHERPPLELAAFFGLVLDLDVVVVALVDPGVVLGRRRRGRPAARGCPIPARSSRRTGPLIEGMTFDEHVHPGRRRERQDAEAQGNAGPDRVPELEPSMVAPNARIVPRTRITPLVPR